ncbi:MAG: PEP-CTERM sorting domain-containing protein [Phycisphaerales bacterium JB063]
MASSLNRIHTAMAAAVVASAGSAAADTLAINFQGDAYSGEFGRAVSQTAFGVASDTWVTDATHTAGAGDGGTSGLTHSAVTFSWTFANDWAQSGAFNTTGATGEDEVYFGYLDDGGDGADITITGLATWLAGTGDASYEVTLIMSTGQGAGASLLDTPLLVSDGGSSLGTFVMGNLEPGHSHATDGLQGYGTISGLTSDTLFVDGQVRAGAARGAIAGIIVTSVPEPGSLALLGLGGLAVLRRRRD